MDLGTKPQTGPIAAIDIGTNSLHLVISEIADGGGLRVLDRDKVTIRLGDHFDGHGNITISGINKAVETLGHMRQIAESYGAELRAVATHATRVANNRQEFINAVRQDAQVSIEIIDGIEEARLVFLGIRNGLPLKDKAVLGVDIGGGSTEVFLSKRTKNVKFRFVTSLTLGAVTLSRQFLQKEINESVIARMNEYIAFRLAPLFRQGNKSTYDVAVASSGSAKALARYHARRYYSRDLADTNGYQIPAKDLFQMYDALTSLRNPKKIQQETGMDANRAEIILAGAAILVQICRMFGAKQWIVSSFGLREGLVADTYAREHGDRPIPDVQWHSIQRFAKRLHIDEQHASQVSQLAICIFDQLRGIGLGSAYSDQELALDRRLIEAASYLYEAGKFISAPQFHKHSMYLIANTRLFGFTQYERQMMGLVVRYHRKAQATPGSRDCSELSAAELERVRLLSSILRIAATLDRTRQNLVRDVAIRRGPSAKALFSVRYGEKVPEVEIYKAKVEMKALENCVKIEFNIEAESTA